MKTTIGEIKKWALFGKITNGLLIFITLGAFIAMHATNFMDSWYMQSVFMDIYMLASVIATVLAAGVFWKTNQMGIKGGILTVGAGLINIVFAYLGMMLGIVIWVLCGMSIRQINKSVEEAELAALPKVADKTPTVDPFANTQFSSKDTPNDSE